MKGPVHSLNTLERPIKDLLKRGYDGGFLIIDISYSRKFLQLRKYIKSPGDYGIELAFPRAKWTVLTFDKLEKLCMESNFQYSIVKEVVNGPLEFLYIDFGRDFSKAHQVVTKILLEVFDVNSDVKLFVRLENATIEDELIS